jgi:hypothetical protein
MLNGKDCSSRDWKRLKGSRSIDSGSGVLKCQGNPLLDQCLLANGTSVDASNLATCALTNSFPCADVIFYQTMSIQASHTHLA